MHPQLELLLQIQDLKSQRRELVEGDTARALQQEAFNVDVDAALAHLEERIAELEEELEPRVRARYERIRAAKSRVVVPVIAGSCYGCFIQIPTAGPDDTVRQDALLTCESCGRFLYVAGAGG
ncbi:MAG TPA: hypothetical protein VMK65_01370 [Longimicrobiales bacterium]|nr:hypothetical protein [Longimicrobiales bacterium]